MNFKSENHPEDGHREIKLVQNTKIDICVFLFVSSGFIFLVNIIYFILIFLLNSDQFLYLGDILSHLVVVRKLRTSRDRN